MLLAVLDRGRVLLIPGKIGVNQFDEPVEVLGSYLETEAVSMDGRIGERLRVMSAYRFVVLIKVVHISVQDFHKELDGCRRFHARVCHTEGPLKALQDSLTITIEL